MDQAVLPRSFLFYLAHRPRLPTANMVSFFQLLQPLKDLVEAIYSGRGALKYPIIIAYSNGEKLSAGIVDESSLECKPES